MTIPPASTVAWRCIGVRFRKDSRVELVVRSVLVELANPRAAPADAAFRERRRTDLVRAPLPGRRLARRLDLAFPYRR